MHRSSNFACLVLTAGFLLCLVASNVSATDGIDHVGREQECDAGGNCSLADDEGKSESDSNCIDLDKECERMKFKCFDPRVMSNMLSQCPKTCGACAGSSEIDGSDEELDMRTQICEDTDGTQCSMEECEKKRRGNSCEPRLLKKHLLYLNGHGSKKREGHLCTTRVFLAVLIAVTVTKISCRDYQAASSA